MLSLPRELGLNPNLARRCCQYWPLRWSLYRPRRQIQSIPRTDNIFDMQLIVRDLLASARQLLIALRTHGSHPDDNAPVNVHACRYVWSCVRHGKIMRPCQGVFQPSPWKMGLI
ncbi:MAG: hypothetical protein IPH22_10715 [Nitrosomonas sp.]|nr:hypothetical protein [Nitrosomonas sp.]